VGNIRRLVLVALVVFVGFVAYHALTPYGWSAQTEVPVGVPAHTISYTCGAPWQAGYVHGPPTTAYPLGATPCGERHTYQILTFLDVVLGVFGIALVAGWGRLVDRSAVA